MEKKRRFSMNKLLRDRSPAFLKSLDMDLSYRILKQEEYLGALQAKLVEEVQEVLQAKNREELQEELADVLEVLCALGQHAGISLDQVEACRLKKKQKRGGFDQGLYGIHVEVGVQNPEIRYYEQNEKYPELAGIDSVDLEKTGSSEFHLTPW